MSEKVHPHIAQLGANIAREKAAEDRRTNALLEKPAEDQYAVAYGSTEAPTVVFVPAAEDAGPAPTNYPGMKMSSPEEPAPVESTKSAKKSETKEVKEPKSQAEAQETAK